MTRQEVIAAEVANMMLDIPEIVDLFKSNGEEYANIIDQYLLDLGYKGNHTELYKLVTQELSQYIN